MADTTRDETKTTKVAVNFTLDIDKEAWCREFDVDPKDFRADVNNHLFQMCFTQLESEGLVRPATPVGD